MLLSTKGYTIDPLNLNSWLDENGGYADGCDIVWGSVDTFGKTSYQGQETATYETICEGVAAGHGIIINVRGGTHWVLVTGCQGNGVFDVNDPGFECTSYSFDEVLLESVYH